MAGDRAPGVVERRPELEGPDVFDHAVFDERRSNARATKHLQGFLKLYAKRDGFTTTAANALPELASPTADCSHPIGVDGDGTALYPQRCR